MAIEVQRMKYRGIWGVHTSPRTMLNIEQMKLKVELEEEKQRKKVVEARKFNVGRFPLNWRSRSLLEQNIL